MQPQSGHPGIDIECPEKVQKIMVSMIPGLLGATYKEKLVELKLDTLEDRRKRQDLILVYRIISGHDKIDPTPFSSSMVNKKDRRY